MRKLALHGGKPVRTTEYPTWPVSGPREEELLRQVLFSGTWGGSHPFVEEFEKLFAGLHDARYAIATASGTLALELALEAAGIGEGDEVVVPAHSFIATATAVSRVGATPIFIDIDRETFNLDVKKLAKLSLGSVKACIPVHFGGLFCDMDELERIADENELILIEDAAHAHGAEWSGRRAGGIGSAGCFSFQNSKSLSSGEGGVVITSDDDVAVRARSLANCGRRAGHGWFEHFELGSNLRQSGFHAAVLLAQLERLGEQIRVRQENARILKQELKVPGVHLQADIDKANVQTLYILPGWVDEDELGASRDELVEALNQEGVPIRPFYPHPLYKNPLYNKVKHRKTTCPVAEAACTDSFWLPQRVLMGSEDDTRDVIRAIEKVYEVYKPDQPGSRQVQ